MMLDLYKINQLPGFQQFSKELLIDASFRTKRSEDPESRRYKSKPYWTPAFADEMVSSHSTHRRRNAP
ncbi:MAG: hypothetical protein ABW072_19060 [Sedimenticola sp.]